ncbi:MAG: hypothetical protein LBV13_03815 [Methanomassiliicoccaceae archaeon]|jgi:trk system potassium uptake protein TrkH|nr:hypothetical protein [Methanomassiliicoccaceae archaeon]
MMRFLAVTRNILERSRRWESTFLSTMGITLMGTGMILLFPLMAALWFGDDISVFLIPAVCCLCASVPLFVLFSAGRNMRAVDGILLIFAVWGVVMGIGSVPYILSGMGLIDGIFESVSGFTTTGSTVLHDDLWGMRSIILWRSMTQWIGGIAIILVFISLFPMLGLGGRLMFENEMAGSGSRNFTAKMRDAALQFVMIYGLFSVVFFVACVLMGTDPFDSVCLMFTTISTGGFLPYNDPSGLGAGIYSIPVQFLILVFMFLGGVNFYLHYQRIYRKRDAGYLRNHEFRSMIMLFAVASLIIFMISFGSVGDPNALVHAKDIIFMVVSSGTTTGFSVTGGITAAGGWLTVPVIFGTIFLLCVIGGSSGSTSGGMKIGRAVTVLKFLSLDLKRRIYPRGVFDVKVNGETMDERNTSVAYVILFLFTGTIAAGFLGLMLLEPGLGFTDSLIMSLSSVTNTGFTGPYGPADGLASLSGAAKAFLSLIMWIGRLEVATAVLIFMPYFWKEIFRGRRRIVRTDRDSSR